MWDKEKEVYVEDARVARKMKIKKVELEEARQNDPVFAELMKIYGEIAKIDAEIAVLKAQQRLKKVKQQLVRKRHELERIKNEMSEM